MKPADNDHVPILEVRNLSKSFPIESGLLFRRQEGEISAVTGVSFKIWSGESLGLVGESGCGKSTTARMILRLIEATSGEILYRGRDITRLKGRELRALRKEIQIVFQDPYSSLNPRMTIRQILSQPFHIHGEYDGSRTDRRIADVLEMVGLSPEYLDRFPNEFSGGQRQRIGIARALCLDPSLLVLDEPVSALDVSIQAQVLNLLRDLKEELDLSYLFIAHDLSVVRHVSDRVAVMYLGSIVETADRHELYDNPHHPYSQALLSAIPIPDPIEQRDRTRIVLEGDPPSPINPPAACRFNPRCWKAQAVCRTEVPQLESKDDLSSRHMVACHFAAPLEIISSQQRPTGRKAE